MASPNTLARRNAEAVSRPKLYVCLICRQPSGTFMNLPGCQIKVHRQCFTKAGPQGVVDAFEKWSKEVQQTEREAELLKQAPKPAPAKLQLGTRAGRAIAVASMLAGLPAPKA